jgi:hypothetical protein
MTKDVQIGQTWRSDLGQRYKVVAISDGFAHVKLANTPKKRLTAAGGYLTALSEFAQWTLIEEAAAIP